MSYEGNIRPQWPIAVSARTNAMGGTDVDSSLLGVDLPRVTIPDYDVDARGFDQIRDQVEGLLADVIADALRVPETIA